MVCLLLFGKRLKAVGDYSNGLAIIGFPLWTLSQLFLAAIVWPFTPQA